MPSHLHERVVAWIEDEIREAMREFARRFDDETAQWVGEIYKGRSTTVLLRAADGELEERHPDATYFRKASHAGRVP